MYPHVHALDVERALDLVPTPAGTTAERERVLRRQGVPFGEKQDWVYYAHFAAFLACVYSCSRLAGSLLLLAWWFFPDTEENDESEYLLKLRMFFAYARECGAVVVLHSRGADESARYLLRRAGVKQWKTIPLIARGQSAKNKAAALMQWVELDATAWCRQHAPKHPLARRQPGDPLPCVFFYEGGAREITAIRKHYLQVAPNSPYHCAPLVRQPGRRNGKRRTYADCRKERVVLPGIFNQREPLEALWANLHANCSRPPPLPPLFAKITTTAAWRITT